MAQVKKVKFEQDGNVSYKKAVVIQIIELAAKEIAGVSSFCTKRTSSMKNFFSKDFRKGINIVYDEEGLSIDVYLNATFGYAVNEIAYRIQENIKRSIESMTEYKVKIINVHIVGVAFEELDDNIAS